MIHKFVFQPPQRTVGLTWQSPEAIPLIPYRDVALFVKASEAVQGFVFDSHLWCAASISSAGLAQRALPRTTQRVESISLPRTTQRVESIPNKPELVGEEEEGKEKFKRHCLLFAHGNGCDLDSSMQMVLTWLANQTNMTVIGFDYFGYGLSKKERPSESGCYESAERALEYTHQVLGFPFSNIHLVGHSLGTAVVIELLKRHANNGFGSAMIISPFRSFSEIIADHIQPDDMTFSSHSDSKSIPTMFDSFSKLEHVKTPVKVVHGQKDTLIPIEHAQSIATKLGSLALTPVWLKKSGHNDILSQIPITEFIQLTN